MLTYMPFLAIDRSWLLCFLKWFHAVVVLFDCWRCLWLLLFVAHLSWKLRWVFLITCCPSVHLTVCKLFTFSSSSLEPLGQFQPNLAQSILGWMRFKCVQMNDPFSRGYNYKIAKIHWRNLKNLLKNHRTNVNQTWHKASLGEGDLSLFKWSPPLALFQGKIITK